MSVLRAIFHLRLAFYLIPRPRMTLPVCQSPPTRVHTREVVGLCKNSEIAASLWLVHYRGHSNLPDHPSRRFLIPQSLRFLEPMKCG